ncbi:MAG: glycosyltransferase family 2 protein [Chloroflexi bacterium]|nr:glycosyltransferase family 2 protein [Chloroflexota bacterium]
MTNEKLIDLSIVIVSYNVRELLQECLKSVISHQSLVTSQGLTTETFVVDNASTDSSAQMVREKFATRGVQLIENKNNRGFAAANNQAFRESRGRYVMMLNPDTVVRAGAFETLVEFMDAHSRAGACGGKLVYADGTFQHSAFMFPGLAQIFFDFFPLHARLLEGRINGRYPRSLYARGDPFQIDHPLGACFLVRRETAEQVGWLDEKFFLNCEEIDWAMRIKRAGWEIWCAPQAEIVHYEAQSKKQFRNESFVNLWRARFYLFSKHYSRAFQFVAPALVRAGLRYLARQARRARVTQDEKEKMLSAYQQIRNLMKQ